MTARVLVLGGEGFIGSHVVNALTASGHDVTTSTRREKPVRADLRSVYVDFLSSTDLARAVRGQDCVVHCVSLTNPALSHVDPFIDVETNVRMSVHLMEACRDAGVKRLVFLSSGGAIYGETSGGAIPEGHPTRPISPYGIGKLAIEGYLRFYRRKYGLDSVVLRLSNVYGPGQRTSHGRHGVIAVFAERALAGLPLSIFGDGGMSRDYIFVSDAARVVARSVSEELAHSTYNVGSGVATKVSDVVDAIESGLRRPVTRNFVEAPETYVREICLDCTRAVREFGAFASTPLELGISRLLTQ